jgi:hypothetical protein
MRCSTCRAPVALGVPGHAGGACSRICASMTPGPLSLEQLRASLPQALLADAAAQVARFAPTGPRDWDELLRLLEMHFPGSVFRHGRYTHPYALVWRAVQQHAQAPLFVRAYAERYTTKLLIIEEREPEHLFVGRCRLSSS